MGVTLREVDTLEVKNNPAGRLHDLLRVAQVQPATLQARNAWAVVFGVEVGDTAALLQMLADLICLVSETKKSIERIEDVDHNIYLKPFKKIEEFLTQVNLDARWEKWKNQLDEPTLYGLQFAADKLSRVSGCTSITEDEIDEIRKELEEFVTSILQSDLPQGLKALLLGNLESIRRALLAYRVRGVEGIEGELERAIGSLVLHKEEIPPEGDKSLARTFWERFFTFVDRINKAVTLTCTANQIAGPVVQTISHIIGK